MRQYYFFVSHLYLVDITKIRVVEKQDVRISKGENGR